MEQDTVSRKFQVETIRINSYSFESKEHVVASSIGLRISLLNVKEANKNNIIDIPKEDIAGMASYFMEDACVLFISMSKKRALIVEDCLGTNPFKGKYQIMFRITGAYHWALSAIYLVFDPAKIETFDESDYIDTLDRLEDRMTQEKNPFDVRLITEHGQALPLYSHIIPLKPAMPWARYIGLMFLNMLIDPQLLIYPPPHKGLRGIQINRGDYKCLSVDNCINDVIIDFYLKYLHEEIITDEQRNRSFIFSQFFYTRLAASGHAEVKRWTKNVNLYEKDFIVVPIIIGNHWILAVICFPHDSSENANEKSCILIFDSVPNYDDDDDFWNNKHVNPMIVKLRDYLTCEIGGKFEESRTFNEQNMPAYIVEVPQQDNDYDSGLYLLQYVENLFQCPINDYRNIDVLNEQLNNWFDEDVINRKREDLATLITKLVKEYNPDKLPLPHINTERSEENSEQKSPESEIIDLDEFDDDEDNESDYLENEDQQDEEEGKDEEEKIEREEVKHEEESMELDDTSDENEMML